jgi:hypothetical protein
MDIDLSQLMAFKAAEVEMPLTLLIQFKLFDNVGGESCRNYQVLPRQLLRVG